MRVALLASVVVSFVAQAEEANPFLAQARVFHQGLEFEKCLKRIDQATKWKNTRAQLAEIELYAGLCHLGLGHEKPAEDHLTTALTIEPGLELPAMQSPKVEAFFARVRGQLPTVAAPAAPAVPVVAAAPDVPRAELIPPAPQLPPTPPPALEAPAPERHLALPLTLGGVAVAGAVTGVVLGLQATSLNNSATNAEFASDAASFHQQAGTMATGANIAYGVAGLTAVTALVTYFLLNN